MDQQPVFIVQKRKMSYFPDRIFVQILKSKHTVSPKSFDPFYIVSYYMKWVKTFWTDSMANVKPDQNIKLSVNHLQHLA